METDRNELGQPIGPALRGWRPPDAPSAAPMVGRYCRLERLDPERHGAALFAANAGDTDQRMWTYLSYGPFATRAVYDEWLRTMAAQTDPLFFAIVDSARGSATGLAAYLRITPPHGTIEIGHLAFSPLLQRTVAATEALYLMMAAAFAQGYRRCEWKCDALNAPSRRAAERLGFTFEGIFRQAVVYRARSRDTAWFSVIDREWPALNAVFQQWLDQANFDPAGRQKRRLSDLTAALRPPSATGL